MSRVTIFLATGLLLAACSDFPASPERDSALRPNFAATTSTSSVKIQESFVVPAGEGGCTQEDILFTGTAHIVVHTTETPSGKVLSHFTVNDQNYAGVGLETGTKYRRVGATNQTVQLNAPLPTVVTFTETFSFIGQGSAPNLLMHRTLHITINANGEVTAEVDNVRVECK